MLAHLKTPCLYNRSSVCVFLGKYYGHGQQLASGSLTSEILMESLFLLTILMYTPINELMIKNQLNTIALVIKPGL